jgi:hypothetical protein
MAMSVSTRLFPVVCAIAAVLAVTAIDARAGVARDALGLRLGMNTDPDQFLIGGQGEFGPVIGSSYLVPSLDFGFTDENTVIGNLDFRWYLLPLPETGIYFYGAAGPTILFSPDTQLGLSLTVGAHIPMKSSRRYNVELRFGLGDIPDLKIIGALMFGL